MKNNSGQIIYPWDNISPITNKNVILKCTFWSNIIIFQLHLDKKKEDEYNKACLLANLVLKKSDSFYELGITSFETFNMFLPMFKRDFKNSVYLNKEHIRTYKRYFKNERSSEN